MASEQKNAFSNRKCIIKGDVRKGDKITPKLVIMGVNVAWKEPQSSPIV